MSDHLLTAYLEARAALEHAYAHGASGEEIAHLETEVATFEAELNRALVA